MKNEPEYLKKYYDHGERIMSVVKIKNGTGLIAYEGTVKIDDFSDSDYYKSIGYKKSNAKEFDSFYTEQMKKFDEILNP